MDDRQIKGYAIVSKGDIPQLVNQELFIVPSQSSNKKYNVLLRKSWTCDCPDYKYRKTKCKHIHAVEFLLKMRHKVEDDKLEIPVDETNKIRCEFCKSENIVKNGKVKNKTQEKIRYLCRSCKRTFYLDSQFNGLKANSKIVVLTMDLYYKGLSLRDIEDTIYQFYALRISHETIRKWIVKFTESINEYTENLKPKVSDVWHTDEQMIKINGKWVWNWNILDEKTRFLIANNITDTRYVKDAKGVFIKAKERIQQNPAIIITDGLKAYNDAINEEFHSWRKGHTDHIRLKTIRDKRVNNNLVERFHNTFRERDKVMRGFKTEDSANTLVQGFNNYYNFIRPHTSLNGQTPSQVANLDLHLDRNRWLNLIKLSAKND